MTQEHEFDKLISNKKGGDNSVKTSFLIAPSNELSSKNSFNDQPQNKQSGKTSGATSAKRNKRSDRSSSRYENENQATEIQGKPKINAKKKRKEKS